MKNENENSKFLLGVAGQYGCTLFRNNRGGFYNKYNDFIRYGLGNTGRKIGNKRECDLYSSTDHVGWTNILITPEMVGQMLPVFTTYEWKKEGFKLNRKNTSSREHFQGNWINMIKDANGIAAFVSNPKELHNSIEDFYKRLGCKKNDRFRRRPPH